MCDLHDYRTALPKKEMVIYKPAANLYRAWLRKRKRYQEFYPEELQDEVGYQCDTIIQEQVRHIRKGAIDLFEKSKEPNKSIVFSAPAMKKIRGLFAQTMKKLRSDIFGSLVVVESTVDVRGIAAHLSSYCMWRGLDEAFLMEGPGGYSIDSAIRIEKDHSGGAPRVYDLHSDDVVPRFNTLIGTADARAQQDRMTMNTIHRRPRSFAVLPEYPKALFSVRACLLGSNYLSNDKFLRVALVFPHDKNQQWVVCPVDDPHSVIRRSYFPTSISDLFRPQLYRRLESLTDSLVEQGNIDIALLPELSVDEAAVNIIRSRLIAAERSRLQLIVAGSFHHEAEGTRRNVCRALMAAGYHQDHHKINQFFNAREGRAEGINRGATCLVLVGFDFTLAVLICADLAEPHVVEVLLDLGVNIILVPGMTDKTGFFPDLARSFCYRNRGVAIFCNQDPPPPQAPPAASPPPREREQLSGIRPSNCSSCSSDFPNCGPVDGIALLPPFEEDRKRIEVLRCEQCTETYHVISLEVRKQGNNTGVEAV